MKKRIYVVSGTHNEFMAYKLLKDDYENTNYVYVSSLHVLRGLRDPQGVFYGSWRSRNDILEIVEQLRVCTTTNNPALDRVWAQVWKSASHTQMNQAAVNTAAQRLSDEIDAQVMKSVKEMYYTGAVGATPYEPSYTIGANGSTPPKIGDMRMNSYIDKMEVYDGWGWKEL
jgi:hypothetical protein